MPSRDRQSDLPSAAGSPFKTKNFNKFFFGIMIAAILLVALMLLYFFVFAKAHASARGPASSSVLRGTGSIEAAIRNPATITRAVKGTYA